MSDRITAAVVRDAERLARRLAAKYPRADPDRAVSAALGAVLRAAADADAAGGDFPRFALRYVRVELRRKSRWRRWRTKRDAPLRFADPERGAGGVAEPAAADPLSPAAVLDEWGLVGADRLAAARVAFDGDGAAAVYGGCPVAAWRRWRRARERIAAAVS